MSFSVDQQPLDKHSLVVTLAGDIDLYAAPQFKQLLFAAIRSGSTDVVIDLSAVTFIDSTALGVMIQARKRLEPRGGSLHVVCCDPAIAKVFEIVGLDRILPIHRTLPDAVAALPTTRTPAKLAGAAPKLSAHEPWKHA